MDFELYGLKNWGGRPNETWFTQRLFPYNSTLSQARKGVASGALCSHNPGPSHQFAQIL